MSKKVENKVALAAHVQFQLKLARQNRVPFTKGEAVKYLLEHEEIVDQKDEDGDTPLMNSCDSGCIESVKVLLARGALVNEASSDGYTALHLVAQYNDVTSTDIARLLVEAGALIDESSQDGWMPLMKAQSSGNNQIQALLIEKGVDAQEYGRHMKICVDAFRSLKPSPQGTSELK